MPYHTFDEAKNALDALNTTLFDAAEIFEEDERKILATGIKKALDAVLGPPDWLSTTMFTDWKWEYNKEVLAMDDVYSVVEWAREQPMFKADVEQFEDEHRMTMLKKLT